MKRGNKKDPKEVRSDFYKRMLAAKEAKASKLIKEKVLKQEALLEPPKVKGEPLASLPEQKPMGPIDSSSITFAPKDEGPSPTTQGSLDKALARIREQAQGL